MRNLLLLVFVTTLCRAQTFPPRQRTVNPDPYEAVKMKHTSLYVEGFPQHDFVHYWYVSAKFIFINFKSTIQYHTTIRYWDNFLTQDSALDFYHNINRFSHSSKLKIYGGWDGTPIDPKTPYKKQYSNDYVYILKEFPAYKLIMNPK